MQSLTIVLPCPPKQLHPNGRTGNWRVRAAIIAKYKEQAVAAIERQTQAQPLFSRVVIVLRYRLGMAKRGRRNLHDPDNLIAWAKTAIDSLEARGVLANDRSVTYAPPEQSIDKLQPFDVLEISVVSNDGRCPVCNQELSR